MDRIVECVPNFSEGRNQATVQALIDAVASVSDVRLLNHTSDPDHHRSVLTVVGEPEAMIEAMFRSIRVATDLIDLRSHCGVHPRVGATDVVPFVPIKGLSMQDCVQAAKRLGHRVGNELDIPVFLYERAASHRDHAPLESVRRGGLEGLAFRMASDPDWTPNFGPSRLHDTAGAIVIGARPPLVAFNVNLLSADVNLARSIAAAIRQSNGGLPHLKAIGVELPSRGMVQVAINLTDYEATSLHAAFTAVRSQADDRGVAIAGAEIVGLVPLSAMVSAAKEALRLDHFEPSQVLETRMDAAWPRGDTLEVSQNATGESYQWPVSQFVAAVAAPTAVPGGGAVAALAGTLAAALGMMGARLTGQAATERRLNDIAQRLSYLLQADGEAYRHFVEATRRTQADANRPTAVSSALHVATEIPLEIGEQSAKAGTLLHACSRQVKRRLQSDMHVGLVMAIAACEAGLHTARENLKIQPNQKLRKAIEPRLRQLFQNLEELRALCYTPPPGETGKHSAQALPGKVQTRDEWKLKSSITTSRKRSKLRRKS
jgi:glutamate formiminotransferase/glutamate formiminotransferase/formiminotetrahydrofolate cyclodeaminase